MAAVTFDGTSATQISLPGPYDFSGAWEIEVLFKPTTIVAAPANATQVLFSAWAADATRQNLHVGYFDDGRLKLAYFGDDLIVPLTTYTLVQGVSVRVIFGYTPVTDESYVSVGGTELLRTTAGPFSPGVLTVQYWAGARKSGVDNALATVQTLKVNGADVIRDVAAAAPAFPDHGAMSVAADVKTTNAVTVAFPARSYPSYVDTGTLDTFARAAGALGASWVTPYIQLTSSLVISSTSGQVVANGASSGAAIWSTQFPADQEVWQQYPVFGTGGANLLLRSTTSNNSGATSAYVLRVVPGTAWEIRKRINGATSVLVASGPVWPTSNGDAIKLRAVGSTLTAFHQPGGTGPWTTVFSITDTSIAGAGYIGLSAPANTDTYRAGTFGGGAVTLSGPATNNMSVDPTLSIANPLLTSVQFTAENMGGMAITQEGLPLYVTIAFGGGDLTLPFTLPGTVGAQTTHHLLSITPQVPFYVPVSLPFPTSKGALVVDPFLAYTVRYVHYHAAGGAEPAGNAGGGVTAGRGNAAVPDQREDGAVPEPRSDGTLV